MSYFTLEKLPFAETGVLSPTVLEYIRKGSQLSALIEFEDTIEGFNQIIKKNPTFRGNREKLRNVLIDQYKASKIGLNDKVSENIKSLTSLNTFTVTTGHQLNILSGPLYVFYKLVSTINLAEQLRLKFPSHNFIPIYWMASEDHDIEEINHINLFGKRPAFETLYAGPSGKLLISETTKAINEIVELLGQSTHAEELKKVIQESYLGTTNLSDATRKWVNYFFEKYGLVILDANERTFKESFAPIIKKELLQSFIKQETEKAIKILKNNFHIQVNPREINLFYLHNNLRNRIVKVGNHFEVLNSTIRFTEEEIEAEVVSYPEKFSPNVLLRPLYQQWILPNIANIGGPAELEYWLELKPAFDATHIQMPILMLRNSALIIDKTINTKWNKFGFTTNDFFLDENELAKKHLSSGKLKDFDTLLFQNKIISEFDKLIEQVSNIDITLKASFESEKHKLLNSLKSLEEKVIRTVKKKEETELNQIYKIKEKLFPQKKLQERIDSVLPYYLKEGMEFIELLKKSFDPFDPSFLIFKEDESNS